MSLSVRWSQWSAKWMSVSFGEVQDESQLSFEQNSVRCRSESHESQLCTQRKLLKHKHRRKWFLPFAENIWKHICPSEWDFCIHWKQNENKIALRKQTSTFIEKQSWIAEYAPCKQPAHYQQTTMNGPACNYVKACLQLISVLYATFNTPAFSLTNDLVCAISNALLKFA